MAVTCHISISNPWTGPWNGEFLWTGQWTYLLHFSKKMLHLWTIKCCMSHFHFNSLDWSVKWWIPCDWPMKKVVLYCEKWNIYEKNVTSHISISIPWTGQWNGVFLGTDQWKYVKIVVTCVKKMCYICYICYMSYFHTNSLDWPVKWWISRDWPVKNMWTKMLHMLHMYILHILYILNLKYFIIYM